MQVAVLGHTGFLGQNIVEQFALAGIGCVGASRSTGVDLRSTTELIDFLQRVQPTVIVNCAANVGSFNYVTDNAAAVMLDNTRLTLALYEAAAAVCPQAVIVQPLANCVYPATATTFYEADWQGGPLHRTVLPFASTRRLAWAAGESFAISYGLRSIYLLVPNMYGPHDSTDPNQTAALDALVTRFLTAQRTSQPEVTVWGTGAAVREWIFAPDLARFILEAARNPHYPGLDQPLNIAQKHGLSIRELVDIIRDLTGYSGAVRWDATKPDGAPEKIMDDARFRQAFPAFSFTDFRVGLDATIAYYQKVL